MGVWGALELGDDPLHIPVLQPVLVCSFQGRSLAKPSAKSSGEPASQGRWVGWAWEAQGALGGPGSDGSCFIPPRNPFIIFSGGMPRASYGDRHCVSVLQGQTLATLDFTSRVIDFFTVQSAEVPEGGTSCQGHPGSGCWCGDLHVQQPSPPSPGFENPRALVVLVEEELVAIDLQTPGWPTIPAPYLAPLHSSAITCSCHVSNVPLKLWERIVSVGEQQSPRQSSAVSDGGGGEGSC